MNSDICTELYEELVLHLIDALLGIEYERFVFFQVGGDIAFGVGKRLAAHVVCWYTVQVRIADLDIVARGLVEAHFEIADTSAFALPLLHLGDPLASIL